MARPRICFRRNPATELIFGTASLDEAGIRDGERFRLLTPQEAIRRGRAIVKCK